MCYTAVKKELKIKNTIQISQIGKPKMKTSFVAISAISLSFIATVASAESNMASWVAKNKVKPIPVEDIQKTEPIQSIEVGQPISQQPGNNVPKQVRPAVQQQSPVVIQHPVQPKNTVGMIRPNVQQQGFNETVRQENTARALEALMPNIVSIINAPSVPAAHKRYAFKYIGHTSQMLADPKNFNVSMVVPGYNEAISCATTIGATNTLMAAHNAFMQNAILQENFQIARSRGNLLNFGQQISNLACK